MARSILDGAQVFSKFREGNHFYVDKPPFIREWWRGEQQKSDVSLILRPRRFGKTLLLSTVEHFFSTRYANRADLFEGLDVWQDEALRAMQGTWPVIFLSLAAVKGKDLPRRGNRLSTKLFGYMPISAALASMQIWSWTIRLVFLPLTLTWMTPQPLER